MDEPELPVPIPARILSEIYKHATEAEPEECCGLIWTAGNVRYGRAVRCQNDMTRRHEEDPEKFPRDNRSAYYMSARDVVEAMREAERTGEIVSAVYHSHVGAAAYLSNLDLSYARDSLFPFPHADQIVLSVFEHTVRESKIFLRSGDEFRERRVGSS